MLWFRPFGHAPEYPFRRVFKVPRHDMGVPGRRADVRVAEVRLNLPEIDILAHEVRGDRMAEQVGIYLLRDLRLLRRPGKRLPDVDDGPPRTLDKENVRVWLNLFFVIGFYRVDGVLQPPVEGQHLVGTPLLARQDGLVREVDIAPCQVPRLGESQAEGIQAEEKRPVKRFRSIDDPDNLVGGQDDGDRPGMGQLFDLHVLDGDVLLLAAPSDEAGHVVQFLVDRAVRHALGVPVLLVQRDEGMVPAGHGKLADDPGDVLQGIFMFPECRFGPVQKHPSEIVVKEIVEG